MRVFQQFDANQDGTIDGGELMTCGLAPRIGAWHGLSKGEPPHN